MQWVILIIGIVLFSLIGLNAWFLIRKDKTKKMSFWQAVNKTLEEDSDEGQK